MAKKISSEPKPPVHHADTREILDLYERLRQSKAKLVDPAGHSAPLPEDMRPFLARLLTDLTEGKSVSIVQDQTELSTVEASRYLGVSRQFFVNLLERNEIPYHKIGTHRRVYLQDLLSYKARRDGVRRKTLDDLVRAEVDDGLYDVAQSPVDAEAH